MCHRRSCLLTILCLVSVPAVASVQNTPDFSGVWVLESATDPDAPKALTVRQSEARTNARGEAIAPYFKTITIERDLSTGPIRETHEIGLTGGYVSGTIATVQRHTTRHSVTWQDRALVFEQSSQVDSGAATPEWSERREVWVLDDDGRLRVTIVTSSSRTGPRTTTAGYRR